MKPAFLNHLLLFVALCVATSSCKKYLDINSDDDTPQDPSISSVFPTQLSNIPRGLQYDARYIAKYTQNFGIGNVANTTPLNWDKMGYQSNNDAGGDIWRMTYYGMGKNLDFIINKGIPNAQWDYVGAAYALKAMSFQYATDLHGEIIFSEAFPDDENKVKFAYDDQETVYKGIDSLCRVAISYLNRTDYNPSGNRLVKGDFSYNGDVSLWKKFVYGLLARNFHRYSNKSDYLDLHYADSVIKYCDLAMTAVAEDFVVPFDAQKNDDTNFFGVFRDNLTDFRQTNFIVALLDGTTLAGAKNPVNFDPRMRHMLSRSADTAGSGNGGYKGVIIAAGDPNFSTAGTNRLAIPMPFGDSVYRITASNFSGSPGKYLFSNKASLPVMTATEMKFLKAEAAFLSGNKALAHSSYIAGINLHFDFINRNTWPRSNSVLYNTTQISANERTAYLASANVKQTAAALNLSDIMLQKYIALWGWGFFETWVDLRRYHYTDLDPALIDQGVQVYKGFTLPATLNTENINRPVYRVRPRFNSEYIWNIEELKRLGGLNTNYHTYEPWFSLP